MSEKASLSHSIAIGNFLAASLAQKQEKRDHILLLLDTVESFAAVAHVNDCRGIFPDHFLRGFFAGISQQLFFVPPSICCDRRRNCDKAVN